MNANTEQAEASAAESSKEVKGIGGWLLLPAIGAVINPLQTGYGFWTGLLMPMRDRWTSIFDPSLPQFNLLAAAFIAYELVVNIVLIAFGGWLMWNFFCKSKRTPGLYCWYIVFCTVALIADSAIAMRHFPASVDIDVRSKIARLLMVCAIWIPYFLTSKRVKNTFTR